MSTRNRTLKLGWRELWPVWLTFGGLFAIGALGLWVLLPSALKPATLMTDKNLTLNLTSQDPEQAKPLRVSTRLG